ncbi:Hypothetical predicted protein [Cloeon dipterum]|uniref:Uncharacterized protein n=1 Tax=Cloeon dipterum TaxID=197152 RepID=A0A8S1DEK5_9INSE|nr:Hypothetical predicted protein [Cloeon dipterum]
MIGKNFVSFEMDAKFNVGQSEIWRRSYGEAVSHDFHELKDDASSGQQTNPEGATGNEGSSLEADSALPGTPNRQAGDQLSGDDPMAHPARNYGIQTTRTRKAFCSETEYDPSTMCWLTRRVTLLKSLKRGGVRKGKLFRRISRLKDCNLSWRGRRTRLTEELAL